MKTMHQAEIRYIIGDSLLPVTQDSKLCILKQHKLSQVTCNQRYSVLYMSDNIGLGGMLRGGSRTAPSWVFQQS